MKNLNLHQKILVIATFTILGISAFELFHPFVNEIKFLIALGNVLMIYFLYLFHLILAGIKKIKS